MSSSSERIVVQKIFERELKKLFSGAYSDYVSFRRGLAIALNEVGYVLNTDMEIEAGVDGDVGETASAKITYSSQFSRISDDGFPSTNIVLAGQAGSKLVELEIGEQFSLKTGGQVGIGQVNFDVFYDIVSGTIYVEFKPDLKFGKVVGLVLGGGKGMSATPMSSVVGDANDDIDDIVNAAQASGKFTPQEADNFRSHWQEEFRSAITQAAINGDNFTFDSWFIRRVAETLTPPAPGAMIEIDLASYGLDSLDHTDAVYQTIIDQRKAFYRPEDGNLVIVQRVRLLVLNPELGGSTVSEDVVESIQFDASGRQIGALKARATREVDGDGATIYALTEKSAARARTLDPFVNLSKLQDYSQSVLSVASSVIGKNTPRDPNFALRVPDLPGYVNVTRYNDQDFNTILSYYGNLGNNKAILWVEEKSTISKENSIKVSLASRDNELSPYFEYDYFEIVSTYVIGAGATVELSFGERFKINYQLDARTGVIHYAGTTSIEFKLDRDDAASGTVSKSGAPLRPMNAEEAEIVNSAIEYLRVVTDNRRSDIEDVATPGSGGTIQVLLQDADNIGGRRALAGIGGLLDLVNEVAPNPTSGASGVIGDDKEIGVLARPSASPIINRRFRGEIDEYTEGLIDGTRRPTQLLGGSLFDQIKTMDPASALFGRYNAVLEEDIYYATRASRGTGDEKIKEFIRESEIRTGLRYGDRPLRDSAGNLIDSSGKIITAEDGTPVRASSRSGTKLTVKTYEAGPLAGITRFELPGAPLGIDFGDAGAILGNLLGKQIAGDDKLTRAATSAVMKTILRTLGEVIDGELIGATADEFKQVTGSFGRELQRSLTTKFTGAVSSMIVKELVEAVGLDGFVGDLVNTAATEFLTSSILKHVFGDITQNVGFNVASAVGSFIGSALASKVITFKSIGGQIGAQIGETLGSIFIGGFIGSFVGNIVGGLIGSIFGGTPRSGADVSWSEAKQGFEVTGIYSKKGGSKDAARSVATMVADTLNYVIDSVGGDLADPTKVKTGNYGMRYDQFVYRPVSTRDKDEITARFKGKDAVDRIVNHGLREAISDAGFVIYGGDLLAKRAIAATIAQSTSAEDFQANLVGNLTVAQSYRNYLNNAPLINFIIGETADGRESVFAAETALTLVRAQDLGLDRRHASDWSGGFTYLLDATQTSAADVVFTFRLSPTSSNLMRVIDIGAGTFNPRDQIDHDAQSWITATGNAETIDLRSGELADRRAYKVNGETNFDVAVSGEDFVARNEDLAFAAGERRKTVSVALNAGSDTEIDEKFVAELSSVTGSKVVGGAATGTVVENADGEPVLMVGNSFAYEADGYAVFRISLSKAAAGVVSLSLAVQGASAVLGSDILNSIQVSGDGVSGWAGATAYAFAAGQTEFYARVAVVADNVANPNYIAPVGQQFPGEISGNVDNAPLLNVEGDERFKLVATVSGGASFLSGAQTSATGVGTVLDGYGTEPLVWIDSAVADEASGQISFNIMRSTTPGAGVVKFKTSDRKTLRIDVSATVDGGAGNDVIHASNLGDNIFGGEGNDTLYGGRLDDWLLGGAGDDILEAGAAGGALGGDGNYLDGGAGNDVIRGREGSDWLEGGDGVDIVTGGAGDDILTGGAGDGDDLKGGIGADQYLLRRGDGADIAEEDAAGAPVGQALGDAIAQRMANIEAWKANPLAAGAMRPDWLGASAGVQQGAVAGGEDAVVMGAGIGIGDVRLQRSGTSGAPGNDLIIQVMQTDPVTGLESFTGTQLTIRDWFSNPFKRVEWLKFADGTEIRIGDITSFIVGGSGDDVLIGTNGNDFVYGGAGDDQLHLLAGDDVGNGGSGNDMVWGDAGRDLLIGGVGNDELIGGAGSDAISGDGGADEIYGGADRDILSGGRGDGDVVVGGAGDDTFKYARGDGHDAMLDEFANHWVVVWAQGVEWNTAGGINYNSATGEITGPGGAVLRKNFGTAAEPDFRWVGRFDYDSVSGTLKYFNPPAGAALTANSGTDTIELAPGINLQDVVLRRDGDDLLLIVANDDLDVADYGSVKDSIRITDWYLSPGQIEKLAFYATGLLDISAMGTNLVAGTDGADGTTTTPLAGTVLADWITAGAGDDVVAGGSGNDILAGNSGSDTLRGEGGDDVLYGGTGNDMLDGGAGKDILVGGSGIDTASYASASAAVRVRLSLESNNKGDAAGDEYSSIENIVGSSSADNIGGDDGENEITGGAGTDVLMGGDGDDTYVWNSASGNDTIYEGGFVVEEAVTAAGVLADGYSAIWTNTGTPSTSGKFYWRLEIRGPGNEVVYDYAQYSYAAGTAMPAPTAWNVAGWLGGFSRTNGQQVTRDKFDTSGSGGDGDTIEFAAGISLTDLIFIRAAAGVADANGADLIIRFGESAATQITVKDHFTVYGRVETLQFNDGLAVSLASILSATSGAALNGTANADLIVGQTGAAVDILYGGDGDDVISGLSGADELYGEGGDDVFEGGGGADRLDGGANAVGGHGDMVRYVKSTAVTIDLRVNTAQLGGHAAGDTLFGIENVVGSQTGGDTITGDANANIIDALDGDNIIDGKGGDDVLIAGSGNDIIRGDAGEDNISAGGGNDQLWGGGDDDILVGGEGDDQLRGEAGNDQLLGGDGDDLVLDGGVGDDEIFGGAGNDVLTGGDGNDRLGGGTGNDTLHGGVGDDYYLVQSNDGMDTIVDASGTNIIGFDTGITHDRIWLTQSGTDLKISVIGEDTVLTVSGFFATSSPSRIKSIQTSTHAIFLDHPDTLNLIAAMTAIPTVPTSVPQAIADAQARYWHQGGKAKPIAPTAPRAIAATEDMVIVIDGNYGVVDHDNDITGYQLKPGSGPAKGVISNFDPATGALTYTPNGNANGSDSFVVIVTDAGGHSVELPVSVTIAAVNDAPGAITIKGGGALTVSESAPGHPLAAGTVVGEFESVDIEGDALVYTLLNNAGGRFAMTAEGKLIVADPGAIDFEASSSHLVSVRVTDANGAISEEEFSIAVQNGNEANHLSATHSFAVNENVAIGTVVGSIAASDLDQSGSFASQRYYFLNGTTVSATSGDGRYAIDQLTGEIRVNSILNFEAGPPSQTYQVVARDNAGAAGYNQAQTAVTIGINDINEAPISLDWSPLVANIVESDRIGSGETRPAIALGTLSVSDPDTPGLPSATYNLSLVDARFELIGNTLWLKQGVSFDFETSTSVSVAISAIDQSGTPFTINRTIILAIADRDDVLEGTSAADILTGQSGRDRLYGFAGDDTLLGGDGNDFAEGGDGHDSLGGGAGVDELLGGDGNDHLHGGDGDDYIQDWIGGPARGGLFGGNGNDILQGGGGVDALFGEGGDDLFRVDEDGGATWDYINGGDGADTISFEQFSAGIGFDLTAGRGSGYTAQTYGDGYISIENITGSQHADTIHGDEGGNVLRGLDGNDTLHGRAGDDTLDGGQGSDALYGGDGADTLTGGAGNDIIYGGAGNDTLIGGDGDDQLYAEAGDDLLDGGTGNDILNGGIDNDTYIVNRMSGADMVNNYDPSGEDIDVIGFQDAMGAINDQDLWFERVGNDLKISVIGTTSSIQIVNWYVVADPASRANHKIDFIVAGERYSRTINIEALATLMATKTKPTTTAARDTLMADLTYRANWATHWGTNAAPVLSVIATQSTNEDSGKSLSVTATDDITPNAQIQLSAQVISGTNVVTNAGISFGAANANGVRSMTINPVANASGAARIRVTATDAGGVSSTQEFDIVVAGVADTPTITQFTSVGGTSGQAGGIALNLASSFPDTDGSETQQIWITGVPSGVTLSAGTYDSATATWRLTQAQLFNLKVNAPVGWSQDLNLTATARATENAQTAVSAPVNLKLVINAAPTGIAVRGLGSSTSLSINEYTPSNNPTGKAIGTAAVIDPDALDRNLLPSDLSQMPFRGVGEERIVTTTGPLGGSVQVVETGQNGVTDDHHGGGLPWLSVGAADTSKAYKFTIYFKPENNMGHSLYFGTYGNIEQAWDGQANGNPYFYYGNSSGFVQDRWYRVEGYVLPSGTALIGNETFGGVFDTVTGQKVADTFTYRFGAGASETGARFFSFYNAANAGYSAQWYQPTIEKLEYSYQLIDSAGGRFAINSVTGLITVASTNVDYEAATAHNITIRVTDSFGQYRDQTVSVSVNNLNEANLIPASYNMAVNENVAVGTLVGTVAATDTDSSGNDYGRQRYYFLNGGTASATSSDGRFSIDALTGQIRTAAAINYEAGPAVGNYSVIARDNAGAAGYNQVQTAVAITIGNVNERPNNPSLISQTLHFETFGAQTHAGPIASFAMSDPDLDTPRLQIVGGNEHWWFTTNETGGQLLFGGANFSAAWLHAYRGTHGTDAGYYYDIDGDGLLEIRVATLTLQAIDAAGLASDPFTYNVYIEDVNEAPTDIWADRALSFDENLGAGVGLAWFGGSDWENNIVSYALINDAGGRYTMRADGLLLTGSTGTNYEAASSHVITVRATDSRGAVYDENFTVAVQNVYEPHGISNYSKTPSELHGVGPTNWVANMRDVLNNPEGATIQFKFSNDSTEMSGWQIDPSSGLVWRNGSMDYEALTEVYEWQSVYVGTDPWDYTPIYEDQYVYVGKDPSRATFNLGVKAIDTRNGAVSQSTLTISVQDVNEGPSVGSYSTYYGSDGKVIYRGAYEYWVTADKNGGSIIQITAYDPERQGGFTYSITNQTAVESIWSYGGSDEIDSYALPYVTINSAGTISFTSPGEGNGGEWEGGTKINGQRRTSTVRVSFTLNVTDAGGVTTPTSFSVTFVRRGASAPPVVLDLDGDGLELVSYDGSTVEFDMDADGVRDTTGWVGADDGLLALDRNGNGLIDDISEISFVDDTPGATTDLQGLGVYDTDGDGYFDTDDAAFGSFLIWRDENQDGVSQAHEMKTLAEWGIRAINLSLSLTGENPNQSDNVLFATTDYVKTDGTAGTVGDVLFSFGPTEIEDVAPPIVFDFDGDGKSLTEMADNKVRFDMNGDGIADKTGWIEQGDAFLALDRNGNGKIDDIKEISFVADKEGAKTDLEGLAAFDSNGDDKLSGDDARFAEFRLWFDNNGNGQTDAGELLSLAQAGVVSISLTGVATGEQAVSGKNIVYNTGGFTRANGETGKLLDVGLGFKPLTVFPEVEFQKSDWQGKAKGYRLTASGGTVRVVPRDVRGLLSAEAGQIADAAALSFGDGSISMLSAILIDLDGDGLEAKKAGKSKAWFDMNADGLRDDTGWMSGGDGMLVIDRDKDGAITQASEFSFLSEKEGAKNSWEGLAALDSNKDGKLDKADTRFGELKVWADHNGDGISQDGEIKSLLELGIAEIGLRNLATSDSVKVGQNLALSTATYKRDNGTTATIGNVALGFTTTREGHLGTSNPENGPLVLPVDAERAASNLMQAMSHFGADMSGSDLRNGPRDGMAPQDWFAAAVA